MGWAGAGAIPAQWGQRRDTQPWEGEVTLPARSLGLACWSILILQPFV